MDCSAQVSQGYGRGLRELVGLHIFNQNHADPHFNDDHLDWNQSHANHDQSLRWTDTTQTPANSFLSYLAEMAQVTIPIIIISTMISIMITVIFIFIIMISTTMAGVVKKVGSKVGGGGRHHHHHDHHCVHHHAQCHCHPQHSNARCCQRGWRRGGRLEARRQGLVCRPTLSPGEVS